MSASSFVTVSTSVGNALQEVLMCDQIAPGSDASYQTCKTIYAYHPLGQKMADSPIKTAQSQERVISISNAPGDRVIKAFLDQREADGIDDYIFQIGSLARVYGVASIVVGVEGKKPDEPIKDDEWSEASLFFNVLDPLNTAGSLVLNQDPNAPDFQKHTIITSAGVPYHRSRSIVLMHEKPLYIEYTTSAFGYVGRSVYQRALFPLKSFISTMVTDDLVARKVGLIVAKLKPPGSIIDSAMQRLSGIKRSILREAQTTNVLSITIDESIETLDMQNVDGAGSFARTNILKNVATAADMPAKLLENETMVAGFGEGTEDARNIARYIEGIRKWLGPVYRFFDEITMRRAWNEAFYETLKKDFPELRKTDYKTAFYQWKNSFHVEWPSLLEDPESEAETEDVRQKAVMSMIEVLLPNMDPANKVRLIQWAVDNAGENKLLFPQPLVLDYAKLEEFSEEQVEQQKQQKQQMEAGQMPPGMGAEESPEAEPKPKKPRPEVIAA